MTEPTPSENPSSTDSSDDIVTAEKQSLAQEMRTSEDWWAIYLGAVILAFALLVTLQYHPAAEQVGETAAQVGEEVTGPLKGWFAKPGKWDANPLNSLYASAEKNQLVGLGVVFLVSLVLFGTGLKVMGESFQKFAPGFIIIFLLATLAYVLTGQSVVKSYNLEYALWALAIGLLISNTIGTPDFVKPAVRTEFYIKTGLVLLGSEVLISKLVALGVPGIFIAWIVTPIVLISTYIFGQKVLKIESKSLNMVISADMSVCGVSAAIATAASCRAKKEELSFAIGLSLTFTVIMMIVLPIVIKALGLSEVIGGAWLGGTIDSTGAVTVAGALLGETAAATAITIKMIQNILIGVTAFGVAVYWVSYVDRKSEGSRPEVAEIWRRFPKFVLGFVAASIVFSIIYGQGDSYQVMLDDMKGDCTKLFRGWFFCLAFVSIGLESNFRDLAKFLKGGKPLMLYVAGQSLNLLLTLFMAWLMFGVIFKETVDKLIQ